MTRRLRFLASLALALTTGATADAPAKLAVDATPAANVQVTATAEDFPWDNGTQVRVTWTADGTPHSWRVERSRTEEELAVAIREARVAAASAAFDRELAESGDRAKATSASKEVADSFDAAVVDQFVAAGIAAGSDSSFVVDRLAPDVRYRFRVTPVDESGTAGAAAESGSVAPTEEWFYGSRAWFALILALLGGTVIACIGLAASGRTIHLRRIAGLDAIDEAIGRATEMGRPVLYIPGIQDMDNVMTVAGVTILGRVAKTTAEYDANLQVPTARSLVMTSCREVVRSAYYAGGRPDAFNPDAINYVTDEQFGFVAYVAGRMVREKPATCIYMGQFYAESLLFAENGNAIGAIQIAGTAETSQLPFFVAACDYTLIGEEFFAASAYLSGEPAQLGSLLGQDIVKSITAIVLVLGVVLATWAVLRDSAAAERAATYLRESVLKG